MLAPGKIRVVGLTLPLALVLCAGCASTRIELKEAFGYEKREQLVDRVQEARDSQQEAQQVFTSALDEFLAVTRVEPGELEEVYARLEDELARSEARAEEVRDNIRDVERVSERLFDEWEEELDDYSNDDLRRRSEQQLELTRSRYAQLHRAMARADERMEPVLAVFRDQVLFLKHNLNARAVAALSDTIDGIESDVEQLVRDLQTAIAEADRFIADLGPSTTTDS